LIWWRCEAKEKLLLPEAQRSVRIRLVAQQPVNTLRHEPSLPSPYHGLALPDRHMISAVPQPSAGGQDNLGAPHMLLWGAAVRDDRFKATAICSRDVHDNSCSHAESLNRFGRFGNRPYESDH